MPAEELGRDPGAAASQGMTGVSTRYLNVEAGGVRIFYREAGRSGAPPLLLLHGYPSSSRMFEPLLPLLADEFRLIAPDYPGFGLSEAPPPGVYSYSRHVRALLARLPP